MFTYAYQVTARPRASTLSPKSAVVDSEEAFFYADRGFIHGSMGESMMDLLDT